MAYIQKGMTQTFGNTTATTVTKLQDNGCAMIPANGPFGNKTIGPRTVIVPADPIIWNESTSYEYLTLVASADFGASYISKRDVPAGTPLTDTDYWIKTGEFNAQIANIEGMIEDINALIAMGFDVITPENTQEEIQQTLNEKTLIVFSKGDYPLTLIEQESRGPYGLAIPSGRFIIMQGANFTINTNNYTHYNILYLNNAENVTVTGNFSVTGDRTTHTGTDGEWGHCISVFGGSNISISGGVLKDAWGDGLYLSEIGENVPKNVFATKLKIDNARRNGISIVAGSNIFIDSVIITNVNGTAPQNGIDVEPNYQNKLGYISIKNCVMENCAGAALQLATVNNAAPFPIDIVNIRVDNCQNFLSTSETSDEIFISNISATNCRFFVETNGVDGQNITVNTCLIDTITGYLTVANVSAIVNYTNATLRGDIARYNYTNSGKTLTVNFIAGDISQVSFDTTDDFSIDNFINCSRAYKIVGGDNQQVFMRPSEKYIVFNNTEQITAALSTVYFGCDFIITTGDTPIKLNAGRYNIIRTDGTKLNTYTVPANTTLILLAATKTEYYIIYEQKGGE